jgi:predicted dehydrogenase
MTKQLNIAYVGFGKSTNRYHIPYVHIRDNFKIGRIVTPTLGKRPEEQAALEATGTIFSTDIQDIINDADIDLVVVVTPAPSHYALAKQLLEGGKNVLLDKPAVETTDEMADLIAIAKANNLYFSPFQNRRFDSDFLTIKDVIEKGYIGNLVDITVTMDHYRYDLSVNTGSNLDGAWYGHGVHMVDQMVSLFGKPERVNYDVRATRNHASTTDDYFSVDLLYPNLRATVQATELAAKLRPKWVLYGDKGTFTKLNVDQQENDLKVGIMPGQHGFGEDTPQEFGELVYHNQNGDRLVKYLPTISGDYGRVYDAIYDTLVDGAAPYITYDEMLTVIETIEGNYK